MASKLPNCIATPDGANGLIPWRLEVQSGNISRISGFVCERVFNILVILGTFYSFRCVARAEAIGKPITETLIGALLEVVRGKKARVAGRKVNKDPPSVQSLKSNE